MKRDREIEISTIAFDIANAITRTVKEEAEKANIYIEEQELREAVANRLSDDWFGDEDLSPTEEELAQEELAQANQD